MYLKEYRLIFTISSLILILIASIPAISLIIPTSIGNEKFSEIWILGAERTARDYPFNVTNNESNLVHINIRNQMGYSNYYILYVKFRNVTDPLPDRNKGDPNSLPPLYEHRLFLKNEEIVEIPISFSFSEISYNEEKCQVDRLKINDHNFNISKSTTWNDTKRGHYFQLIFELWIFEEQNSSFEYNNHVGIWLNLTKVR